MSAPAPPPTHDPLPSQPSLQILSHTLAAHIFATLKTTFSHFSLHSTYDFFIATSQTFHRFHQAASIPYPPSDRWHFPYYRQGTPLLQPKFISCVIACFFENHRSFNNALCQSQYLLVSHLVAPGSKAVSVYIFF